MTALVFLSLIQSLNAKASSQIDDDLCRRYKFSYTIPEYRAWEKKSRPSEQQKKSWIDNKVRLCTKNLRNINQTTDPDRFRRATAEKCAFEYLHEVRLRDQRLKEDQQKFLGKQTEMEMKKHTSESEMAQNKDLYKKLSTEEKNKVLNAMKRHQENNQANGDSRYAKYFPYLLPIAGVKHDQLRKEITEALKKQGASDSASATTYDEHLVKESYAQYQIYSENLVEDPEVAISALEKVNPLHVAYFGLIDPNFKPRKRMKADYALAHERIKTHKPSGEPPSAVAQPISKTEPTQSEKEELASNKPKDETTVAKPPKDTETKEDLNSTNPEDATSAAAVNENEGNNSSTKQHSSSDSPAAVTIDRPCAECNLDQTSRSTISGVSQMRWISREIRREGQMRSRFSHSRHHHPHFRSRRAVERSCANLGFPQNQNWTFTLPQGGFDFHTGIQTSFFMGSSPFIGSNFLQPLQYGFQYNPYPWAQGQMNTFNAFHPFLPSW